jgi:hypothetical protein
VTLLLSSTSCLAAKTNNNTATPNDPDIYERLGVQPPAHNTTRVLNIFGIIKLPISRWSWRIHGRILPILHFFDSYDYGSTSSSSSSSNTNNGRSPRRQRRPPRPPPDVFVNLRVLWCKLLSSLDPNSLAYEGRQLKDDDEDEDEDTSLLLYHATYRMLSPSPFKWSLRYLNLWKLFPRWMHANIELRTVYINNSLKKVITTNNASCTNTNNTSTSTSTTSSASEDNDDDDADFDNDNDICFIILGGGYDPRGAKLAATASASSSISYDNENRRRRRVVYELDLPVVVESKQWLLRRAGFNATTIIDNDDFDSNDYDNDNDNDSNNNNNNQVRLIPIDLNNDIAVDYALTKIRNELINSNSKLDGSRSRSRWHVVVISEAVLMYLKPGKADRIIKSIAERFGGCNNDDNDNGVDDGDDSSDDGCFVGASFVFADRLIRYTNDNTIANTNNNNKDGTSSVGVGADAGGKAEPFTNTAKKSKNEEESDISQWLNNNGRWKLHEFLLKPGATRHLGIATTTK